MFKLKTNKGSVLLITLLSILLGICGATAQSVNQSIEVRANVPLLLEYDLISETSVLIIKKNNIKKGIVNIKSGIVVSVTTNNANGYSFLITSQEADFYTSATISINNGRTFKILPNSNVEISMPFSGPKGVTTKFDFQILIPQDINQGDYSLPFILSVHPL